MKFTTIAMVTAVMASSVMAIPIPQPEPAKKGTIGVFNGFGNGPGQVYRREAVPEPAERGKKGVFNGFGNGPGQVYRREAKVEPVNTSTVDGSVEAGNDNGNSKYNDDDDDEAKEEEETITNNTSIKSTHPRKRNGIDKGTKRTIVIVNP